MCSNCDLLAVELLLSEVEAEVIADEVAAGLAPSGAIRPLFSHELRARTHFAELDTALDTAVERAAAEVLALHTVVREAVMEHLFDGVEAHTPAEVMAAMETLLAEQPLRVREAVAAATARLQELFAEAYAEASELVIAEAIRQGAVPAAAQTVAPAVFEAQAAAVAAHPWRRITGKVMDELGKPAALVAETITADDVQTVLDQIKVNGTTDLARQSINTASGLGRNATAEIMEPDEIWASEIMDRNTCAECSHMDGKDYASMEEARVDYPVAGFKGCRGESRCRGSLVYIFPSPE